VKRIGTVWSAAWLLTLGACLLLLSGAVRAQTDQDQGDLTRDWNLRIGMFIPQMHATRAASSTVGLSAIAERTVYRAPQWDLNIGIGYNGTTDIYAVPITATGIVHVNNLRYGFGAGYAFGRRIGGGGFTGATILLLVGYQFTHGRNPLSADLRYYFVTGTDDELDGYSLTIGMQF